MNKFKVFTSDIFSKFDWDKCIIAGGFIFGLMNNVQNSMIESTDIDIFIYGDSKNERVEKLEEILTYFKNFDSYYIINQSVVTIITKKVRYNIQVILTDLTTPDEIIGNFDASYIKIYYNGEGVYGMLETFASFKYQATLFGKSNGFNYNHTGYLNSGSETRMAKTLKKGIRIINRNDKLLNVNECKIVNNTKLHNDIIKMNADETYNAIKKHFGELNVTKYDSTLSSYVKVFKKKRNYLNLSEINIEALKVTNKEVCYGEHCKKILIDYNSRIVDNLAITLSSTTFFNVVKSGDYISVKLEQPYCNILKTIDDLFLSNIRINVLAARKLSSFKYTRVLKDCVSVYIKVPQHIKLDETQIKSLDVVMYIWKHGEYSYGTKLKLTNFN